ncbi:histidinol-phosphate aminotransferase [Litorivivens lipolytica]|uniref:Histidinol-phosphate aminotransferase n=1 Tax=Litorivivens lipolytica TaxID=1524264 RepID=A0A7W4Z5G6_9GAMM|nr:histidinol-phosphate transaminase [Litorivivens lipolytica]MBB3047102.1 histidinol-phosphate aminotransferase [Litorivivens lipolytica]
MTDTTALIERWVRPEIRAIDAYHVPPADGMVKLDAMENPYSWPPEMVADWQQRLEGAALNRYPDATAVKVKEGLRKVMGIADEHDILLGNGSDEIIQLLAMAVAGSGRTLLAPEPGFVMYRMIASFVGMGYCGVPLDENFDLDLPAMLAAIERTQPALVFLAMPNNPTGNLFSADKVEAVIKACPGLVVIDEAYTAFTDADHLPSLQHPNVLVMRTLSKVGLAGLRLGILIGAPAWLHELDKLRLPYNINVLTQVSAEFALDHFAVLTDQTQTIRREREALFSALAAMDGVTCWPSEANFILLRCAAAREVHATMKAAGVLVKCLDGAHPALADCLRFTVGTPDENARMLDAFKAALAA